MANNRNDSERRYYDDRGHGPRTDRDYDSYRFSNRERDIERGETERESGWRGAYRERFERRSSNGRDIGGYSSTLDHDYVPAHTEFEMPYWRVQGLRPTYSRSMTNDFGFDMALAPVNYAGRGPKGYRRSDERIKEDVCEVLERHPLIDASEMEISVTDGVVVLRGAVENRAQKRLAEFSIENLSGVKDVRNELLINQDLFKREPPHASERK